MSTIPGVDAARGAEVWRARQEPREYVDYEPEPEDEPEADDDGENCEA